MTNDIINIIPIRIKKNEFHMQKYGIIQSFGLFDYTQF